MSNVIHHNLENWIIKIYSNMSEATFGEDDEQQVGHETKRNERHIKLCPAAMHVTAGRTDCLESLRPL